MTEKTVNDSHVLGKQIIVVIQNTEAKLNKEFAMLAV